MKPQWCARHRSNQTARSAWNSVNEAEPGRPTGLGGYQMDLCGKVAVITGGKRIGRGVARELAERGMNLVLSYRGSKDGAEQTVADVEAACRLTTNISGDVSKSSD